MSNIYIGDSTILAFELVSDDPKLTNISEISTFELVSDDLKSVNVSEILAFELRSYDELMPTFAIVLDFIMETGGIF